jgi:hypothetical protein
MYRRSWFIFFKVGSPFFLIAQPNSIRMLKDPGTGDSVEMRIGCHSSSVVAGIVGLKMPR